MIPAGADWTLKGTIPLRSGVQLVGARGPLGERPVLRQAEDTHALFTTEGANDVRIEGLQLIGPRRTKDRFKDSNGDKAIHVQVNPGTTGRDIRIVDNEIDHWSVAVGVDGDHQADTNREYDALCEGGRCPKLYPKDAGQVRVERNYIHENVAKGGGYGVVVGGGAYATIEANVFEYNNHSIAASGRAFSGYVARYNYVLRGVLTFGEDRTKPHNFDVHGRGKAAEKKYVGGLAGFSFDVSQNTILGSQDYGFAGRLTRAAFGLRGRPTMGARFTGNVVTHDDFDEAVKLSGGNASTYKLTSSGNKYGTDYSKEIAAGDFDGDGRDDVLVANGTGWFFSRAGIAPWEFLMPSRLRIRDVHLADVDGDRRTDVIVGAPGTAGLPQRRPRPAQAAARQPGGGLAPALGRLRRRRADRPLRHQRRPVAHPLGPHRHLVGRRELERADRSPARGLVRRRAGRRRPDHQPRQLGRVQRWPRGLAADRAQALGLARRRRGARLRRQRRDRHRVHQGRRMAAEPRRPQAAGDHQRRHGVAALRPGDRAVRWWQPREGHRLPLGQAVHVERARLGQVDAAARSWHNMR